MSIFLPFGLEYNLPKAGMQIRELLLPLAGFEVYSSPFGPEVSNRAERPAPDWRFCLDWGCCQGILHGQLLHIQGHHLC